MKRTDAGRSHSRIRDRHSWTVSRPPRLTQELEAQLEEGARLEEQIRANLKRVRPKVWETFRVWMIEEGEKLEKRILEQLARLSYEK